MKWKIRLVKGREAIELKNEGYIDEIVIQDWFHLEVMDRNRWWIRIGDACINVDKSKGSVIVDVTRNAYDSLEVVRESDITWRIGIAKYNESVELVNDGCLAMVAIQSWFCLEMIDTSKWQLRVGDAQIHVDTSSHSTLVDMARGVYGEICGKNEVHVPSVR